MADMKTELTAKIVSKAEFDRLSREQGIGSGYGTFSTLNGSHPRQWWARRETLRLDYRVYQTTPEIDALNRQVPVYAHISLQDPKRVAYTPDKAFGERDAQLVTTLGKLLTKFYPAMTDDAVQAIVASYEAEISDDVEFIEHDGIAEAYRNFGAIGACMSKPLDQYIGGVNPAEAYNAPGIRLAVLRDKENKITSRSLVYEASEIDKRFIRCTPPNGTLQKRLIKHGYTVGTWIGAKFKTIKVELAGAEIFGPDSAAYIVPYLDGMGSTGATSSSMVAMIDGCLTGIAHEYAKKLESIYVGSTHCATGTGGTARLRSIDSSSFIKSDYFTSLPINTLEQHFYVRVAGVDYVTMQTAHEGYVRANLYSFGVKVVRLMLETECLKYAYTYFDRSSIEHYGYALLDASIYGPDCLEKFPDIVEVSGERKVRSSDTAQVITSDGESSTRVLKGEVVLTGKNRHVKLTTDFYAMPDTKTYLTPSGKRVHPLTHDIVQINWTEQYEFRRNTTEKTVLGKAVYVSKVLGESTEYGSKLFKQREKELRDSFQHSLYTGNSLSYCARRLFASVNCGSDFGYRGYSYNRRLILDSSLPIHEEVERILAVSKYYGNSYESRMIREEVLAAYADMTATEAQHYLAMPVVQEITVQDTEECVCE